MQQYTYFIILFFTVVCCFIFSFHTKIKFNIFFKPFLISSLLVSAPFLIWDAWFTQIGVWWFNDNYIIGLKYVGLPIEECLFFICIPFSCVFTYYCINKFFNLNWTLRYNSILVYTMLFISVISILLFIPNLYTTITSIALISVFIFLHFIVKATWIANATLVYIILFPCFMVVNGILTGTGINTPVVNYNESQFSTYRILTIPIEDFFYGYILFLLNIYMNYRFSKFHHSFKNLKISSK